jgi:hypothetical protein
LTHLDPFFAGFELVLPQSGKSDEDLHAVVESTFAIVFFGTPQRGSGYANYGKKVAQVASLLTMRRYNERVVRPLARDTEIFDRSAQEI